MALLGIDYGTAKVGLALSDETETLAFPLAVLLNDVKLLREIGKIIAEKSVTGIVMGESKNFRWQDNPLMKRIHAFAEELKAATGLPVTLEPEFLTTAAARYGSEEEVIDAAAAALILQSFLDKRHRGAK